MGGDAFEQLNFRAAHKKPIPYKYVESVAKLKRCSFAIAAATQTVRTPLDKTTNTASAGDFVICGPLKETYVVKPSKVIKAYSIVNTVMVPNPEPRVVAKWSGDRSIKFRAPWGQDMTAKPGDYIVKQGDGNFYAIDGTAFKLTYEFD
jgi:hypothetical protein